MEFRNNCYNCKFSLNWLISEKDMINSLGMCSLHWKMISPNMICSNYQKESRKNVNNLHDNSTAQQDPKARMERNNQDT